MRAPEPPRRKRPISISAQTMDPQPPSPKSKSRRRVQQAQYATAGGPLQLPSLPRFHPAAYGSNASSLQTTPSSTGVSPGPLSPRTASRLSEPQRHLANYHQTLIAQYSARDHTTTPGGTYKPPSPKLMPLAGSPGAVTPLELEGENYLAATNKEHMTIEAYIREEAKRRGDISPRRPASLASA